MSDYLVTGKKGNGKSLVCVGRIRDAIWDKRPVATNLDIYLENMVKPTNKTARLIRLPDRPTAADMLGLGIGNKSLYFDEDITGMPPEKLADVQVKMLPGYREEDNGVIVLDELATWLNSRSFGDKERQPLLDYFTYSRKLGWDVYFIAQAPNQVDKQLREALTEYLVVCKRLDKIKIPVIGVKLPRVHLAAVKYGHDANALVAERWIYRGNDLFACYDTTQRFSARYDRGPYSLIPPGYFNRETKPQGFLAAMLSSLKREAPAKPKPLPIADQHPLVKFLAKLPPEQRVKHWQRCSANGAFNLPLDHPAMVRIQAV